MKQTLLNLIDSSLSPFGVRVLPQDQVKALIISNREHQHNRYLADLYRRVCLQPTPRPKRRGRTPTLELLTKPQVRMVRNHQLSTAVLARKLGVSWPTANKLRDELC